MIGTEKYHQAIENIKKNRPLVHHITNYVVANVTANFTLAMGASPIMATSIDEVAEIANLADALVLNIGTISLDQFDAMKIAAKIVKDRNKKVVLDPVGVGASKLRYNIVEYFIKEQLVDVVKGNYAEILVLEDSCKKTKGVDSLEDNIAIVNDALNNLSTKYKCIFAATGKVDLISNGVKNLQLEGGHFIMQYITGTGCIATASIGTFLCVLDALDATIYGLYLLKKTASKIKAEGPAEFYNKFIDKIYKML
jgi:hydroxyethylthiazole kinase